ncbi:MAG: DNA-binding MarR family transcriptional regulator [Rhodococcus sp. (in: high G+C Gram-positive bacteria)]|jgi:DNA-binding MarR family transcriptional regulator
MISSDLRAMSAVSEEIGRAFGGQHALGPNDFRALLLIMVADVEGRPLTAGELGTQLGLSSAAMTYLVERMIDSGHIRREKDASDRRKVILRYDEHGMAVAREFFGPLGARTSSALAGVSDTDLDAAHRVFALLIDAMRTHYEELRLD